MENNSTDLEKLAEEVKQELLNGDSQIGYVVTHSRSYYMPSDSSKKPEEISRPMSRKMFDLGRRNIGIPGKIAFYSNEGGECVVYENEFISYDDCTEEQKKAIDKRKQKVEKFTKKVSKDRTGKYDKAGKISVPVFKTNNRAYDGLNATASAEIGSTIEIEVTQRELAEAGILPEDFKWMEKARVSTRDIAEADKEQGLTATEVGGFKGFIKKLLDKFKGIGEK